MSETKYRIAHLDRIEPTPCPCGQARRAFMEEDNSVASLHVVEIEEDAEVHYHKRMTEIYYILEGEGFLELDGERVAVKPQTAIMIHPGTRHRAIGKLKLLNIPIPKFDPQDEWFD
jgi:mannose-6-phosphate isomerase-like protein (cupin superfamily)